jgi:hypothetical protein
MINTSKHLHGATLFYIKNPNFPHEQLVTHRELDEDRRAINLSEWQPVLAMYGWDLTNPPSVELFYDNDILCIDAELPTSLQEINDKDYEKIVTDYTRAVANLIFPHLNISELPVGDN